MKTWKNGKIYAKYSTTNYGYKPAVLLRNKFPYDVAMFWMI